MQGLIFGIICLVLGLLGFINWWGELLNILKGILPLVLIGVGLLALSTGIGMVKGTSSGSKEDAEEEADAEEDKH